MQPLKEHIETVEGYFRRYDSVQLLGSIGFYLLDNIPNLEKRFMAQMNGTRYAIWTKMLK
jgi:hypothetical protein